MHNVDSCGRQRSSQNSASSPGQRRICRCSSNKRGACGGRGRRGGRWRRLQRSVRLRGRRVARGKREIFGLLPPNSASARGGR